MFMLVRSGDYSFSICGSVMDSVSFVCTDVCFVKFPVTNVVVGLFVRG